MSASLKILKYTGYGAETEVSSIGFKRIDSVVAGAADGPVDDTGDAVYYQIYTPEGDGITACSFEVWFKLAVDQVPDNQLSNVRLYVAEDYASSEYDASIKVGLAQTYRRPTNSVSDIATTELSTYTQDSPLAITKDGLSGYEIDGDALTTYSYQVTVGDTGSGNVFYLNAVKQDAISLVNNNTYIFNNTVGDEYAFRFYTDDGGGSPDVEITDGVTITNAGTTSESIEIDTAVMFAALGSLDNILYTDISSPTMGASVTLIDPDVIAPNTTFNLSVEVVDGVYYIDDVKNPVITFEPGNTYVFTNANGSTNPFRLFSDSSDGGTETGVIVNGVTVDNGATDGEVITVVASDLFAFNGKTGITYQSTTNSSYGNRVQYPDSQSGDASFPPITVLKGTYNMNTAGDKTDFIVMQVQVTENTVAGEFIPDLKIEWDES